MTVYDTYCLIGTFNICLLFLLLINFMTNWFGRWSKAHDGHVVGFLFKWWAICCLIIGIGLLIHGWNTPEAMAAFTAKARYPEKVRVDLLVFGRMSMVFMIATCFVPYIIGREIHSGYKLF